MMSRNSKILKTMTVWCCLLLVVTGCAGSTQISGDVKTQKAGEREVTLLEPEGAAGNYEAVTYRNLYKAEIYPATVDFDTKEYAYSTNQTFASYGTLPGETVQIDENGNIYINGELLEENYGAETIQNPGRAANPITLGDDEYFVMGDNRNNSKDSRSEEVGNVKRSQIIGRAWLRIWPLNKFGLLKHQ